MASVSMQRVIDKFELENITPEIDISKIKISQPDINRPALQLAPALLWRRWLNAPT